MVKAWAGSSSGKVLDAGTGLVGGVGVSFAQLVGLLIVSLSCPDDLCVCVGSARKGC